MSIRKSAPVAVELHLTTCGFVVEDGSVIIDLLFFVVCHHCFDEGMTVLLETLEITRFKEFNKN